MSSNLGHVATWVGVIASVLRSGAALSTRSMREARRAADAAERAAKATERKADAAEKALPPSPPAVAWKIEKLGQAEYRLCNVGTQTATGVIIDMNRAPAVLELDLGNGTVRPDMPIRFLIMEYAEAPTPDALWVSWDGQAQPVPVPVP